MNFPPDIFKKKFSLTAAIQKRGQVVLINYHPTSWTENGHSQRAQIMWNVFKYNNTDKSKFKCITLFKTIYKQSENIITSYKKTTENTFCRYVNTLKT